MFHKPKKIINRSVRSVEKVIDSAPEPKPIQVDPKAQEALERARAAYYKTRDHEHWLYMQACIDQVEKQR